MITPELVKELRLGDVVQLTDSRWGGTTVTGPVRESPYGLCVGPLLIAITEAEIPFEDSEIKRSLTIISRAPRPLYVNRDREKPVPGDVVRFQCDDHPEDAYTDVYLPRSEHDPQPWVSLTDDYGTRYSDEDARADHLDGWTTRLLVDGETGQVAP